MATALIQLGSLGLGIMLLHSWAYHRADWTMIPRPTRRRIVYVRLCTPPLSALTLLTGLVIMALD